MMHHVGSFLDFKQQKPTGKVKQKRNVLGDSRSLGWKLMLESWSWFLKIVARGVQTSAAGSTPPSRPVTTLEGRLPIVCPSCASQLEIQRTRGAAAAAAAKSLQSCLTLCDPIVGSPPGSSVHGILQARTLEWVAISFSKWSRRAHLTELYPCALCPGMVRGISGQNHL